ncbi:transposase [Pricia sp.]|uniref:transposase n=1 Tax=Pricia sp. TaxID=2268138 RepID=UPI003592F058
MNRPLPFKGFYTDRDGSVLKRYWTAPKDCRVCPMKSRCVPNTKCKKITGTVYDEQYLRAYGRQHSEKGKQMKKPGQSTVEPVFGSSAQFYGLRKIGVPGKAGAHKVMLMTAIAFNLKKYLKKGGKKPSLDIFKTIMNTFQGCPAIFCWQIQPRPVLLKTL